MERDLENTIELRDNILTVLRFWESNIKADFDKCLEQIIALVKNSLIYYHKYRYHQLPKEHLAHPLFYKNADYEYFYLVYI